MYPKINNKINSQNPLFIYGLIALVLSFISVKARIGEGLLDDRFHHGEYFSSLVTILNDQSFIPLTIHGALDYIPGLLSILLFERENYLFYTNLIYLFITFLSCLILYLILFRFSKSNVQNIINAMIVPFLTDYRDFSILLLIFFYFLTVSKDKLKSDLIVQIFIGLLGALNFYYSANRGVAGTISVGVTLLFLAFFYRSFFISILSFIAFTLIASYLSPLLSLNNYLDNLLFLTKTSYQWSYGLQYQAVMLSFFLALWLFIAFSLNIRVLYKAGSENNNIVLKANLILLGILSLFYFQIGSYRADFQHIKMGLIIFIITFNYYVSQLNFFKFKPEKFDYILFIFLIPSFYFFFKQDKFLSLLFLFLFFKTLFGGQMSTITRKIVFTSSISIFTLYFLGGIWTGFQHGLYNWVRLVANPLKNSSAVDPSINWVASELNRTHSQCIFDLSNNGLVNAISNLPACTRFSYIIYADKKFEGEIIDSLTAKLPPAIVYSSDYWSYSIDGKNMIRRFPNLDLFIKRNYPIESCNYGYCMRYKD